MSAGLEDGQDQRTEFVPAGDAAEDDAGFTVVVDAKADRSRQAFDVFLHAEFIVEIGYLAQHAQQFGLLRVIAGGNLKRNRLLDFLKVFFQLVLDILI